MTEDELYQKIKRIHLHARRHSEQLFAGEYKSAFKGLGMAFAEVRPYSYGDDWRHIDWNVTARSGMPHIKVYQEEREQQVLLIVDISPSTFTGARFHLKRDAIAELCATFAYAAALNNDRIGLVLFDEKIVHQRTFAKGFSQCKHIIRDILRKHSEASTSNIAGVLQECYQLFKRKTLCIVVSDFEAEDFQSELSILSKKHEVIGIWVTDESMDCLPDLGIIPVTLAESGQKIWIDSSADQFKKIQQQNALSKKENLRQIFKTVNANLIHTPLTENFMGPIHQYFANKKSVYVRPA
jgi:uncharacterized protein (DUF58 family)